MKYLLLTIVALFSFAENAYAATSGILVDPEILNGARAVVAILYVFGLVLIWRSVQNSVATDKLSPMIATRKGLIRLLMSTGAMLVFLVASAFIEQIITIFI